MVNNKKELKIYRVLKDGKITESEVPGKYAGNGPGKIFGCLDCKSGMRMKKKNRVFFLTWDDAVSAGYRPCKNCKPTQGEHDKASKKENISMKKVTKKDFSKIPDFILEKVKEFKKKKLDLSNSDWNKILEIIWLFDLTWNIRESLLESTRHTILKAIEHHKLDVDIRQKFFSSANGVTIEELGDKFGLAPHIVRAILTDPPKHHKVFGEFSLSGEEKIFCLPVGGVENKKEKIWTYLKADDDASAVDIIFPDDIGWKGKKPSDKEKMRIVPLADIWFGHHLHKEATFDERIAWIKDDPHVFCFLNGDIVHPSTVKERKDGKLQNDILPALMEKFRPIAHKILWAQAGCFEDKLMESKDSFDPVDYLCSEWDIPYFRDPISVGIHWAGNLFEFFCIHGKSTANKKGSKLNAVLQVLSNIEFRHFIVMSHIKDSIFNKPVRVMPNIKTFDIDERKQFVVTTPSFTRYKGSQGAKRGYQHPFGGQMNFTLYKDGDYHLYVSGVGSNFFELKGAKDGQK